jgi:hypothetical protein
LSISSAAWPGVIDRDEIDERTLPSREIVLKSVALI